MMVATVAGRVLLVLVVAATAAVSATIPASEASDGASPGKMEGIEAPVKPNIIFFLVDDLGHYNMGFSGNTNASTPFIDSLARDGIILSRHYTFKYCSPTRSSFLSGRLPVHVNTENRPTTENGGVDLRMTTVAEKMKLGGYTTAAFGKWHGGGYTEGQLPVNRGFDASVGYLNGNEDHYNHFFSEINCTDMWKDRAPLKDVKGMYGDSIYLNYSLQFIANATKPAPELRKPFFLYHAFQNIHVPLEVPKHFHNSSIAGRTRRIIYGMTSYVDYVVETICTFMKQQGIWDNTLIVLVGDNGGEEGHGVNYPFRGFKYDSFEGGVRTAGFIGGALVPKARRGTVSSTVMHVADWYATFASMAQVDPFDNTTTVPASDAINIWPHIMNDTQNPRETLILSSGAVIQGDFKLVNDYKIGTYSTPDYPFSPALEAPPCDKQTGCLFDLAMDPHERYDISAQFPEIKQKLNETLQEASKYFFQTGDDGYVGAYKHCYPWSLVRALNGGYASPLCFEDGDGRTGE